MADTRYPLQWHIAVTGPFCSFSYSTLNLFLVSGWPGSGTTSITSRITIWTQESNNKPSADVSVSYCHHFVQIGRSQCCGVIVVCCSPGPCRWPPPPASGRSLLRCSPSVRTPSPDSSEPPSSYRSHVPTRPGRTLCRQREDSLLSLSSSHMVNLTDIWLINMRHLLSQLYNIMFNSSVVPQIWCCVMANWIVCKSVN